MVTILQCRAILVKLLIGAVESIAANYVNPPKPTLIEGGVPEEDGLIFYALPKKVK